jgi:leucyl/phenylalanyl-tRNA--protein transferase
MIKVNDNPPLYFLNDLEFPNPYDNYENDGFIGASSDLSVDRLLSGYSQGFFPWYQDEDGMFHWFVLKERMLLFVDDIKITKKLAQKLRSDKWEIKYNTNFDEVIKNCSTVKRKREDGTWISDDFINSYSALHNSGFAISVESYYEGELVGGFYGVGIGKYFSGESMFAKKSDASKLALIDFALTCKESGIKFIDCQVPSEHLGSMGGKILKREEFIPLIKNAVKGL